MEKANLPVEKAIEPDEEACQPQVPEQNMTPQLKGHPAKKVLTFADDTDTETPSQKSSSYKEVLSQPATSLSHRERLAWLQKRRTSGLWAQCDDCSRWRFLPNVIDSYDLPNKWYCRLNPDPAKADCSVPEAPIHLRDEEDLIHSEYSAGSVVWARMAGWPWWPAMVDDCPDTEQYYWLDGFSDIPTHYNVVFFDSNEVTRAWIAPEHMKPFTAYKNTFKPFLKDKRYKTRLQAAVKQADDAVTLPLEQRLEKYSFLTMYKGNIISPRKVSKKELEKHQKRLKRKFNIHFEELGSDDEAMEPVSVGKKKNVIILGTRKNKRARTLSTLIERDETDVTPTVEEMSDKTVELEAKEKPKILGSETIELNTEASSDTFKKDSSMAVQVGSTADSATAEETFDNDTSKTYVPENEFQGLMRNTKKSVALDREFEVVIASPSSIHSDDFEY